MDQQKVNAVVDAAGKLAGKAEDVEKVLIIFQRRGGGLSSIDNDILASEALLMVEAFKHWLLSSMTRED